MSFIFVSVQKLFLLSKYLPGRFRHQLPILTLSSQLLFYAPNNQRKTITTFSRAPTLIGRFRRWTVLVALLISHILECLVSTCNVSSQCTVRLLGCREGEILQNNDSTRYLVSYSWSISLFTLNHRPVKCIIPSESFETTEYFFHSVELSQQHQT